VIAIVGRPNVGKSTLFNRLVGRRQALVRDVPGVTRDRLYGQVSFERWQATLIDTGGFDPSSAEPLIEGVRRQVLTAVEEADLVLFVVDAREGPTALDEEIARHLRRANRPVVVAVQGHPAGRGRGVAPHVRQGLPDQLEHVGRHDGELRGHLGVDLDDGDHAAPLLELLAEVAERLVKLSIGKDAGAQPEDVVAEVPDDPVDL